jgi:peptidyl-prolyl cis-trans isomerase A (cyclophilin A)
MARTGDPNSATSQFFINVKDNAFLDAANSPDGNGYAVFGKVVSGMDVVEKIRNVPTTTKGMFENVPTTPVVIKKATLEK